MDYRIIKDASLDIIDDDLKLPNKEYNIDKYIQICPHIARLSVYSEVFYWFNKDMDETEMVSFYNLTEREINYLKDYGDLINITDKDEFLITIQNSFNERFKKDIKTIFIDNSNNYFELTVGEYVHRYKFEVLGGLLTPMINY